MLYVFITLIVISIVLFIVTFFMNDKFKEIESQLEQFSISTMQDTYQLNKKLKVLEEELLTDNFSSEVAATNESRSEDTPVMIQKVYQLYQQGFSVDDISKQTNLKEHDVRTIINNS